MLSLRTQNRLVVLLGLALCCQAVCAYTEGALLTGRDGALDAPSGPARQEKAEANPPHSATRQIVGMELWTYRHQLAEDLPGTLASIRRLGFTDVETASFYGHSALEFHRLLDSAGLTCSSIIVDYDKLKGGLPSVVADAKALGARYVITAGFPHKHPLTVYDVRRAAADFNTWGESLKRQGLEFGYHPHGFEFEPSGNGTLFDMLLKETHDSVTYELDTYHMLQGGGDPVKYLQNYPRRFALVHLKDMAKGTPTSTSLAASEVGESSVVLGTGIMNWPAFFAAAKKAGVSVYYIEDESPAAPAQVPESIEYLKSLKIWK